ncbi:unnamed protein product [Boreogadus saida]
MDRNKYRRTEPLSVGSQGGPQGPRRAEAGLGARRRAPGPGCGGEPTGLRVHMKSSLPPPVAGSGSSVAR